MFPILIDFGRYDLPLLGETHLFLPTYGLLFALATIAAWFWFLRRGRALGIEEDKLFNLTFYTLLAGILGAKLTLVMLDWEYYLGNPQALWGTLRAAGVLMGGVLAGTLTFVVYGMRHDLPLRRLGDAIVAPVALAQAVGRLGCFSAGCCWGRAAGDGEWSVTFTSVAAHDQTGVDLHVPLIPVQLYQMTADLLLAGLLTWLWRRKLLPDGTVAWLFMLLYSVSRGLIEFWRGDSQRGMWFQDRISTSQMIAIFTGLFAIAMLLRGGKWRWARGGESAEVGEAVP